MTTLPDFQLETYFSRWEFSVRYNLAASDAQSLTVSALLDLADDRDRAAFGSLPLSYTQTYGAPELREAIASTYEGRRAADILCFAGGEEALYIAMRVLLEPTDHAIVVTPNYQSAETIPAAICDVTGVALRPGDHWSLDIDEIRAAVRPNTRLIAINFPHNPTGKILEQDRFDALIALCRKHGIWLLSDEVNRPLGATGTVHLPQATDVYERGISIGVMSKAYGLPGLRIGWIACADHELLQRMERYKHYTSICNSGPSEQLALIALKARDAILDRQRLLLDRNLERVDAFFREWSERFEWRRPDGGCIAFPRYLGPEGVEVFAKRLVEEAGILLLPASNYQSTLTATPADRFRIGFGRNETGDALTELSEYLRRTS